MVAYIFQAGLVTLVCVVLYGYFAVVHIAGLLLGTLLQVKKEWHHPR